MPIPGNLEMLFVLTALRTLPLMVGSLTIGMVHGLSSTEPFLQRSYYSGLSTTGSYVALAGADWSLTSDDQKKLTKVRSLLVNYELVDGRLLSRQEPIFGLGNDHVQMVTTNWSWC